MTDQAIQLRKLPQAGSELTLTAGQGPSSLYLDHAGHHQAHNWSHMGASPRADI